MKLKSYKEKKKGVVQWALPHAAIQKQHGRFQR